MIIKTGIVLKNKRGTICKIHSFCNNSKRWVVLFSGSDPTLMRLSESHLIEEFRESEEQFSFPYHLERWSFLRKKE